MSAGVPATIGWHHPETPNWTFNLWLCLKSCQTYFTWQRPYKGSIKMTAVLLPDWKNKNHLAIDGALASQAQESGFKCSQIICRPWRRAHATGENLIVTINLSQKSLKELAKKHVPPNYIKLSQTAHTCSPRPFIWATTAAEAALFSPEAWLWKEFWNIITNDPAIADSLSFYCPFLEQESTHNPSAPLRRPVELRVHF